MNFNAPEFVLFFPTVLIVYALVFKNERLRDLWLLAASYFFYMSWNWKYAGLLLLSTSFDYVIGLRLEKEPRQAVRKLLLLATLTSNLGMLAMFKYYNFFVDSGQAAFEMWGLSWPFAMHHLLLPVGISFYTFETLSYTIDVYRREIPAEKSFIKIAMFISYFPHLVAGPIVRARDLLPQFHRTPDVTQTRFREGLFRVFRGLIKKVVFADLLANLGVDAVFAHPASYSSLTLLFALYGYAFQIYNDFSGYSDVAIGASRMLGFDIKKNFDRPYLSQNMREFWTRWHISLSTWLRDYLYIPLGGNRQGPRRTTINLMITMLLGGLWHGAAWNFVLWGAYHGILLVFSHGSGPQTSDASLWRVWWRRLVCFHLVLVGWLFFRVHGIEHLGQYLRGLMQLTGGMQLHPYFMAVLAAAAVAHYVPQDSIEAFGRRVIALPAAVQGALYAGLILAFCALTMEAPAFIYFQF